MADVNQYGFSYEEIVIALIKQLDINEGLWTLNINFRFEAKNIRKDSESTKVSPGFIGMLDRIGLIRATKNTPGLTVDAAKVNPKLTRGPRAKVN
ncbi:hypothetical protein [Dyella sp.]|uniref:hypothetical protein n=1 Tax=Dyella sp. TaxID=1869338 RepID=UPI002B46EAFB|nr:hypothetical protein [Dyella sp.]HKT27234.1 hypothetical protein [Dyella sp.]